MESRILWFLGWCREGESNPQGTKYRRILSPPSHFSNLTEALCLLRIDVFRTLVTRGSVMSDSVRLVTSRSRGVTLFQG